MEIYLLCFFTGLAIRKVMGEGWGGGGSRIQSIKKNPVKVFRNIQNLPCHQHKKNPIPGEDGELHLKKVRVITRQNQEIDSVNPTWR